MEDNRKAKKTKVITKLTKKMDTMKHEMYNTHQYRQKLRTLVDFEKKPRMGSYKHFIRPKVTTKSTFESRKRLRTMFNYLWDVKIIPLYKIFKDTRKIIFYTEWFYVYKEMEIASLGNEILRESKKKNLITSAVYDTDTTVNGEELGNTIQRMLKVSLSQIEKLKRCCSSLKRYFNKTNLLLPDGFALALKNTPCVPLFIRRPETNETQTPDASYTTIEKYKLFLNTFKRCESAKSVFYKFNKLHNSTSLHQSFTNCIKKIAPSRQESKNVKELCLNARQTDEVSLRASLNEQPDTDEGVGILKEPVMYLDSISEGLTHSKYKIDFINLYLGDIDPDTVNLPIEEVFYPFDTSKITQDDTIGEDNSTSNVIENNLYGVEREEV